MTSNKSPELTPTRVPARSANGGSTSTATRHKNLVPAESALPGSPSAGPRPVFPAVGTTGETTLGIPEPVAKTPQQAIGTKKEAATQIRRLAKAATTRVKLKLNQAQAEYLVDGVLDGAARTYVRFNTDGSGGEAFIAPQGDDGWVRNPKGEWDLNRLYFTGITRLARFDGDGSDENFHGYDLPFGSRTTEDAFNETLVEANNALLALGLEGGYLGCDAPFDSDSNGATFTQEDSVVAVMPCRDSESTSLIAGLMSQRE
ncbi:hypothetical protein [Cryobacterium sp. PH31-O1]|uniref:hypothetical protein n=1 Tax=Cryobacterium sp. PH31-O1 TaxID=3046306 RepID=UPI0024BB447D|nr:hypothetical protein [Cryobacterium sp. PH31-O1]MDJ0338689.1 hypothetical protein [Cryobacterium sp. PH31-O1]